jgi:hypothetical protein
MSDTAKLSQQWVDGIRRGVAERRNTTARFLAQLKNQTGDYADAHRAVIAECDRMLAAPEMAEMLLSMFVHVSHGGPTREEAEALLKKAGVL